MKVIFTPYIYIVFFILYISGAQAQEFHLTIKPKDEINKEILNSIHYKKKYLSKQNVFLELDSIINRLEKKGFLNATLDTVFNIDSIYTAQYKLGAQIKSLKIYYDKLPINILSEKELQQVSTKVTDSFFEIPFANVSITLQLIADNLENKGNSFVQVSLKNIYFKNDSNVAEIKIVDSRPRRIDKVIVKGYKNFPVNFIKYDLNLKTGTTFNKEKLKYATEAINGILFVDEQKPPEVLFTNDSTYIYLYLKKNRSNKFDGVIGFSSKEEQSGLEFNGYLDFSFNNIFNRGETIALFWKNNGNESQRFYIGAELPYIFNLPLIPKVNFEIYRQDSTYNNITTDINLSYNLNTKGNISAILNTETSNKLSESSDAGVESFKNVFYGVSYQYKKRVNDYLFPTKFNFELSSLFGSRKIESVKTNQSKFILQTNYLWSINNRNNIFFQNQSAILNSENYVLNELFRIGGTNSIRGVNEESIFASTYSIFTLEYRYRPNFSSYFYTITDYSYIENTILKEKTNIYSLGLGYAFFTKIGLLNISYAIGKFDDNPFVFNNSKLHIKVISYF